MAHYYCDTSALVKYYILEKGTRWMREAIEDRCGDGWANVVSTSALTWVETISALTRRRRSGDIPARLCAALMARFLRDGAHRYVRLPIDDVTINLAVGLIQRHSLRAYDAVQLATALRLDGVMEEHRLPSLIFVSADGVLCQAAEAEGLVAVDPNEVADD